MNENRSSVPVDGPTSQRAHLCVQKGPTVPRKPRKRKRNQTNSRGNQTNRKTSPQKKPSQ